MQEWEQVAKDKRKEGIKQKFVRNPALSELLIN